MIIFYLIGVNENINKLMKTLDIGMYKCYNRYIKLMKT